MIQPMGGFVPGVSPFAPPPVARTPPVDYTVRPAEADVWYAWTEDGHPYEWLSEAEYRRRLNEKESRP